MLFLYNKNNENHKYPSNDARDLPDNIRFGDALGEWESEMKGNNYIKEICVGGAKSYSYIEYNPDKNTDKVVIKQKGITLDRANSTKFTFDTVRDMVLNNTIIESEKRFQFVWNQSTKDIETRYISRSVRSTFDSKRNVCFEFDSLPLGYEFL